MTAENPLHGSWRRFLVGLLVFMLGLAMVILVPPSWTEILWVAVALILCGFALAMSGYAVLLVHRLRMKARPPGDDNPVTRWRSPPK